MGVVSGSVCVEETGRGVAGLPVSVIDVDDNLAASKNALTAKTITGDRLGSVLTDEQGCFQLTYDGEGMRMPNLAVVVGAPEGNGKPRDALFVSGLPRKRAGQTETFAIRLPAAGLEANGVTPPAEAIDPLGDLAALERSESRTRALEDGVLQAVAKRVAAERRADLKFETDVLRGLQESLSAVPANPVRPQRRIMAPDEIEAKNLAAIKEGVANRFTSAGALPLTVKTVFHLTPGQQQRFDNLSANGANPVTAKQFRGVLLDTDEPDPQAPAVLVREQALLKGFVAKTRHEQSSESLLGIAASGAAAPTPSGSPAQPDKLTKTGLADLLGSLVNDVEPPEGPVVIGRPTQNERPDQNSVQDNVDKFGMRPGPADTPATFDFHRLEIAFDKVWQAVVDEDVVESARQAYHFVRRNGGDFADAHGTDPIAKLTNELRLIQQSSERPGIQATATTARMAGPRLGHGFGAGAGRPENGPDYPHNGRLTYNGYGRPTDTGYGPDITSGTDVGAMPTPTPWDLLGRLKALLAQSYPFSVYGAAPGSRSVNFGVVITYRQIWTPVAYQAGPLVKTVPLAPGESRRIARKTVARKSRAEKEVNRHSSQNSNESGGTTRAESEIVRKAMAKTNFTLTANGTYNFGIAKGDSNMEVGRDASQDSADTKKDFRESVIKSAQEYRQENSTEVTTENLTEDELTDTSEIKNENNELTVTYLFYELQRRYRINERLHRVTPIVLVAQEVPNPSEITDAFILSNDWILRRVLLDDKLLPALDYLADHVEGDRLALQQLRVNVDSQRTIVKELHHDMVAMETQAGRRYQALLQAVNDRITEDQAEESDSWLSDLGQSLGMGSGQTPEAAKAREEAARDAEARAVEKVKELSAKLQREVTALNEITDRYAKLLSDTSNREVSVARLLVHFKKNLLYYMQAIWAHEVPDQRYLRLHQVKVPVFEDAGTQYQATGKTSSGVVTGVQAGALGEAPGVEFEVKPELSVSAQQEATLAEVADIDNLLGFQGNYMILPLKQPNPLVEVLMAPYIDSGWHAMDPSEPTDLNLDEFAQYVVFLQQTLPANEFEELKPELKKRYQEIMLDPLRQGEEIVVPTDSLFAEALPGSHPLLEDFKLMHRALDVKTAQFQVRLGELENVRVAARVLEGELGDPDVDKQIVIDGGALVVTPDD
jgi:hypothetical protein